MKYSLRPRWWILEILMVLMIGMLLIEPSVPLTPSWHKAASLILVIIVFALVGLWVHVNRAALALWEQSDDDLPLRRTYLRNEPPMEQAEATDPQARAGLIRAQPAAAAQQSKDR
ncbi:MAG TPA: hypothetical protein VGD69_02240 [Herpetosiphonaceae bacterium]